MTNKQSGPSRAGYHRIATFVECPQKFAYRWVMGLVPPVEGQATGVGTVLHEALEAHYTEQDPEAAARSLPERYGYCMSRGLELFKEYVEQYPVEPWEEVLAAEHEVEVSLGGHLFTRKLDLIVLWGGKIWVMDHKTAGKVTDRLRTAELDWSLATQEIAGEAVLPKQFGYEWGGFALNIIGTGRETVKKRYKRQPLNFPARFLSSIPRSLHWYCERIEALKEVDAWSYPRANACVGRYGICPYLDLCRYGRNAERNYAHE